MIGNDVIDLALAKSESRWERRGFLDKLFNGPEQKRILNAPDAELMLWNLWSRKEAAYKIYNRETGNRAFMPLRLVCRFDDDRSGKVTVDGRIYFTRTEILAEQIHTIAVRELTDFDRAVDFDRSLEIVKINHLPYLKNSRSPVSISHHGRFERRIGLDYNPSLDLSLRNSNASV